MTSGVMTAQSKDHEREPWYTPIEAARYLGIHRNTLDEMWRQGKAHPIVITPRNIQWPISELNRILRERQERPLSPPVMPPPPDPTKRGRGRPRKVR